MGKIKNTNTHTRYLYILWVTGIVLLAYLCFPFFDKSSGMYLGDIFFSSQKVNTTVTKRTNKQKENTANEALLFVTINKKQFLTKFVTYVSDEDLADKKRADTSSEKEGRGFLIVERKRKPKKPASGDFFIKAAPKI